MTAVVLVVLWAGSDGIAERLVSSRLGIQAEGTTAEADNLEVQQIHEKMICTNILYQP